MTIIDDAVRELTAVLEQYESQRGNDPEVIYGIYSAAERRIVHVKVSHLHALLDQFAGVQPTVLVPEEPEDDWAHHDECPARRYTGTEVCICDDLDKRDRAAFAAGTLG